MVVGLVFQVEETCVILPRPVFRLLIWVVLAMSLTLKLHIVADYHRIIVDNHHRRHRYYQSPLYCTTTRYPKAFTSAVC